MLTERIDTWLLSEPLHLISQLKNGFIQICGMKALIKTILPQRSANLFLYLQYKNSSTFF